ncbi:ArnT family glycosyltransferase [Lutimonas sp.]|uniref:ArnT family glycosyltransferase n=1 Tax=Lutimonas sp. TaxID=1872403 RepID=UPI003D9B4FD7
MNTKSFLLILVLVCLAIFFPHLKVAEVNIMEARNFISAREMLLYDNWFHTTMNLLPRYEKPPLPTWLTAASASVFGLDNLFGLRLPAALSSVFLVLTFFYFGIKIFLDAKQSFIASLILATSFYIVFSGRNGQWDIFTHAFMLFAIYQFLKVFNAEGNNWKQWILIGLFLGFSSMSKGPVSFFALLLPFLISYGIVYKYKGFKPKTLPVVSSIVIFILVGLTWGMYIYFTDTATAEYIANKETASWSNREVKPFYHYWSFFTQSGIWTFFAFIALLYPFMIKRVENKKAYRFSLFWTLSAVVLLSMVPEKKERYLLPVLIPLAMNTSFYINYLIKNVPSLTKVDKGISNFGFGLIGLIGLAFPFVVYFIMGGDLDGYWTSFFLSSISLFSLGILMFYWLFKKAYEKNFYGVILFICSIILFAFPMAGLLFDNDAYSNISTLRDREELKELKICTSEVPLAFPPEYLYHFAEPVYHIKTLDELAGTETFGLLVHDSIPAYILNEYNADFNQRFDLNLRKRKEGKRNNRKVMKLYVLEKKE